MLADALRAEGLEVEVLPSGKANNARAFDAVIVGGALYANRWHRDARRFVEHHVKDLRRVPVWFFSSGPLDDSATRKVIPPVPQVEVLMERVGAQGHVTFGGRLTPDAHGFPASAMAKKHSGDWRAPDRVRAFAAEIARALPSARPRPVVELPGRSLSRVLLHGVVGWAAYWALMGLMAWITSMGVALVIGALATPAIFGVVAHHYFRAHGARGPLFTAATFAGLVALLDTVVVAGTIQRSFDLVGSVTAFWIPLVLLFFVTWATGAMMSMIPARVGTQSAHAR